MPIIPAICNNPNCRTMFPSGIAVSGNGGATLIGNMSGPCPNCGSMGIIPDGLYKAFDNKIFAFLEKVADKQILLSMANTLKKELNSEKSPKNIKKKLNKKYSTQKNIWNLIPETKQDAYAFIAILIALFSIIIGNLKGCQNVDREIIINQTFQYLYTQQLPSATQQNPSDDRIVNKPMQDKLVDL